MCFVMVFCWFALIVVLHVGGMTVPFVRTAAPLMWLGLLGLIAGVPAGRFQYVALALLLPGFVLGVAMWAHGAGGGNWAPIARASHNPDILYGATPATLRGLRSISADRIDCSVNDEPVCLLAMPSLRRSGVSVVGNVSRRYEGDPRCALGSHRPPASWHVLVFEQSRLLGILCS
jgi:hypothetical protein